MKLTKLEAKAALDALTSGDAEAALKLIKSPLEAAASADPAVAEATETAVKAMASLFGVQSPGEVLAHVQELKARADAAKAEQDKLDMTSRAEMVSSLVELGVELPAYAWDGDPEQKVPAKRLLDEPLDALRARVKALKAAHTPKQPLAPERSVEAAGRTVALTDEDKRVCKERGWTHEEYAAKLAAAVRRG